MLEQLTVQKRYRVNTAGNIGNVNSFEGYVVGYLTAAVLPPDSNASTNHDNLKSVLGADFIAQYPSFDTYNYVAMKLETGDLIYLGTPWIVPESISEIVPERRTIVLNNFKDVDNSRILNILRVNGYEVQEIK